jgi:hypothetical protein
VLSHVATQNHLVRGRGSFGNSVALGRPPRGVIFYELAGSGSDSVSLKTRVCLNQMLPVDWNTHAQRTRGSMPGRLSTTSRILFHID